VDDIVSQARSSGEAEGAEENAGRVSAWRLDAW